jgi:beta-fructofuranosidase
MHQLLSGLTMKNNISICLLFLVCAMCSVQAQTVAYFNMEGTTGDQVISESISNTNFSIVNHFNKPEFINGVSGKALRLDGYSTWASSNFSFPGITKKITVEAWFTTESFTAETAAIVSQESGTEGFSLEVGSFGNVSFSFHPDGAALNLKTTTALEHYKWYHLVAQADLIAGTADIFINGEVKASITFATTFNALSLFNGPLYLGRHSTLRQFSGFNTSVSNGAIDEITIYNDLLSSAEILNHYQQYNAVVPDLFIDPDLRHAGDFLRPRYHAMPNTSWTNESYGLIFFNGKYHLFFQKNPNGPYLYFMHWGHLTSPDLVNWTEEKIALSPNPGFDSFGIWSGTTIYDTDGRPVIIYTGVDGVKAGIGVAFPQDDDLISWTKYGSNPVISSPPVAYAHMDFRDPYVWKEGSTYYMIVGSGLQNSGGGILFTYKSTDLRNWQSISPLYRDPNVDQSGVFWEMPFFHKINDTDYMLEVLPTPTAGKRAHSIYWIGKFESEKFIPYFTKPKELELIDENLLAPAIGTDEAGHHTYIGIIPEDRSGQSQVAAGWRHTFSLPRQIRLLKDSTIGQVPHSNLCRLRTNHVQVSNRVVVKNSGFNIPEIEGNQVELNFKIKADSASKFFIQLFKHADQQEVTSLVFDLINNKIGLDRQFSTFSSATKNYREANYIFDYKDTIDVKVFLDHSTLEAFVDNAVVFSCRVYPSREESKKIDLIVDQGTASIVTLDAWSMNDMNVSGNVDVCEIPAEELPDALRKKKIYSVVTSLGNIEEIDDYHVYPNPAELALSLETKSQFEGEELNVKLYSSKGGLVRSVSTQARKDIMSVEDLPGGIYYLTIQSRVRFQAFKIIIQ